MVQGRHEFIAFFCNSCPIKRPSKGFSRFTDSRQYKTFLQSYKATSFRFVFLFDSDVVMRTAPLQFLAQTFSETAAVPFWIVERVREIAEKQSGECFQKSDKATSKIPLEDLKAFAIGLYKAIRIIYGYVFASRVSNKFFSSNSVEQYLYTYRELQSQQKDQSKKRLLLNQLVGSILGKISVLFF